MGKDTSTHEERWREAKTLSETVYEIVKSKRIDSPEFKSLLSFYGRKKLLELYHSQEEFMKSGKREI